MSKPKPHSDERPSLIFNGGRPYFTPDLTANPQPITDAERAMILSELRLIGTAQEWHKGGETQQAYAELAMVYSTVYAQRVEASSLLLAFQTAITEMEVQRADFEKRNGKSERTEASLKRNQLFMHVHQFASGMVERNNQALLIAKYSTEKLDDYRAENEKLKARLAAIEASENF